MSWHKTADTVHDRSLSSLHQEQALVYPARKGDGYFLLRSGRGNYTLHPATTNHTHTEYFPEDVDILEVTVYQQVNKSNIAETPHTYISLKLCVLARTLLQVRTARDSMVY